jgi:microcystin degradation protein MlrC
VHFRADFEPLADEVVIVTAPGANTADPAELPLVRVPATMRRWPRSS